MILTATLPADLDTPLSVYLKLTGGEAYSFLLESVEGGTTLGRYSVIGCDPDLIWELTPEKALDDLRKVIADSQLEKQSGLPPVAAGLFGYLGFDTVRLLEKKLGAMKPHPLGLPHGRLIRPRIIAIVDHVMQNIMLAAPIWPGDSEAAAKTRLENAVQKMQQPSPALPPMPDAAPTKANSNMTQDAFQNMVTQAKEYITAGDIFQGVLSQRFTAPLRDTPLNFYRRLRRLNPSPFLVFMNMGDHHIAASSPEILVRLRDGEVTIRPIAGTRPRGATLEADLKLEQELLADPKERAEHLMLLDLGRNDVGRVSEIGSVRVTDQFTIERYSHVMHIVSNVVGKISPQYSALDALLAGFPAGTVSGAPKIRAIEIIDELEPIARGHYGGAIGYFSAFGELDSCIALRTAVIKDGIVYAQAGGGIVADSDPAAEYEESKNKALALLKCA
jgi:anthranilate synthase component 1